MIIISNVTNITSSVTYGRFNGQILPIKFSNPEIYTSKRKYKALTADYLLADI